MDYLGLEKVEQILDKNAFLQSLAVFLKANDAMTKHVRIRIQVWANDTTPGYLPGNRAAHVLFSGSIINKQTDDGKKPEVSLITSTFPRIPHEALPSDVKWSNGINYILAARQAQSRNADDALMMTSSGWVSETTIANIFWIRDEFVFTPSVACDLLPGIARNTILEILDEMGANANQGAYSCDFLKMADAVWVCNSVRGMRVVRQIDKTEFSGNHPFMEQIEQRFASNIKENLQYVR